MAQYGNYSDNRYNQQAGNPYAEHQSGNPYAQQQPGAHSGRPQPGGYGQIPDAHANGNSMEMGRVNGGATNAGYSQPPAREDPYAILNESQDINRGIDTISQNLRRLQSLQQQALDDPDASQNTRTNRELDALSSDTMTLYRSFAQRVTKLKQTPGAGNSQNSQQLGRVDRKLKEAIQEYQRVDAEFRKKLQEQMARQYRIVRPDASDSEVREAVSDTSSTQVFSQALLQGDRRGQSQSALRAVQGRHEAIQKIEQQVIELAQLFEDMNRLVVEQEPVVTQINEQSEVVHTNVNQANTQLDGAIKKAAAARRKKWYCLGIAVLILIIVAVIVAAVVVTQKRS